MHLLTQLLLRLGTSKDRKWAVIAFTVLAAVIYWCCAAGRGRF